MVNSELHIWLERLKDSKKGWPKPLLDWPESIKESQRNWIGRSEGSEIDFNLNFKKNSADNERRSPDGKPAHLPVFTTRADTLFGVTYIVISPEHLWVTLATDDTHDVILNKKEVKAYVESAKNKTEIDRMAAGKEKTGVEVKEVMAINPANGEEVPIYVADYVIANYGTGVVMAVPAHDERDLEFAKKYNLPIKEVIDSDNILINSGKFDGMDSAIARKEITEAVGGRMTVKYKLKDWVFSRQRYWGEPIPVIHCEKDGIVPVTEKDLPVRLPEVESYEPTDTGESPLADIPEWVNTTCPKCGGPAKRETNTMPQWAGSSWYYLRYADPKNEKELISKGKEKYWQPVDMYIGGAEHATRHLIYARFWHKFLYDIGVVHSEEPFIGLRNQGLILAEDGRKMSKRFGNVINPDDIVEIYGADTLRIYEMFMGPFDQAISWSTKNMIGSRRFVEKVWKLREKVSADSKTDIELESLIQETIQKVTSDIEDFKFNTAISTLMIFVNRLEELSEVSQSVYEKLLVLLSPFAPHVSEELWSEIGNKNSIYLEEWPKADISKIISGRKTIVIQVDGKVRGEFEIENEINSDQAREYALKEERIRQWIDGREIAKVIYIPGKLVSIVTAKR